MSIPKSVRFALVFAAVLMLGFIVTLQPADAATPQQRETDSVVHVYAGSMETDVTDVVLQDLGLIKGAWEMCRTTPMDYASGSVQVRNNRLYVTAYTMYGDRERTIQENILVQACTETEIRDWVRVAILITSPSEPVIEATFDTQKRCELEVTNTDKELNYQASFMNPKTYRSLGYMFAAPGETSSITFPRKAPKWVSMTTGFSNVSTYLSGVYYSVNTKACTVDEYVPSK
ncbi:MAG TPA: hypothetical protein VGE30_03860 [Candidatus Saccharimonadales bacterium]